MMQNLDRAIELAIKVEIDLELENLICKIRVLAKTFGIADLDKKSPFKNVLSVASETDSVEAVKNFIRYQVGRKESSPIWKHKSEGKFFAEAVNNQIDLLRDISIKIVDRVIEFQEERFQNRDDARKNLDYLKDIPKQGLSYKAYLSLVRLFLGYLAREHTACVGEKRTNSEVQSISDSPSQPNSSTASPQKKFNDRQKRR